MYLQFITFQRSKLGKYYASHSGSLIKIRVSTHRRHEFMVVTRNVRKFLFDRFKKVGDLKRWTNYNYSVKWRTGWLSGPKCSV